MPSVNVRRYPDGLASVIIHLSTEKPISNKMRAVLKALLESDIPISEKDKRLIAKLVYPEGTNQSSRSPWEGTSLTVDSI
jgi:hypothetical protein